MKQIFFFLKIKVLIETFKNLWFNLRSLQSSNFMGNYVYTCVYRSTRHLPLT